MRRRIVGLTVVTSVLAAVLLGVPFAIATSRYFVSDQHRELERAAELGAVLVSRDGAPSATTPSGPAAGGGDLGVYGRNGRRISGSGPIQGTQLVVRALHGSVTSGDLGSRYAAAAPVTDGDTVIGAILVTAGPGAVRIRTVRACAAILAVAVVAVLVAWLVAVRLASRIAAPVGRLAESAERLGEGDFSVRTVHAGIVELDVANRALNRTAQRLGDLVARERSLASDASHQLRTPLTGLQLSIEAALADPAADLRGALQDALGSARSMDATVTDLLALARGRRTGGSRLDIATVLHDAHGRWNGLLAAVGRPLRLDIAPQLPVSPMSAAAATQILDVLLDNALRHGQGAVRLVARDTSDVLVLDVEDEGPGPSLDPQLVFDGNGIGLPLARRLAEAEGGRLVLSARGPTRFTLVCSAPDQAVEPT